MRKSFLITVALFLAVFYTAGQIPAGYYDDAIGKTGDELKEALHDIIKGHEEYSYGDLRDFILPESDEDPNNSNNVILIYSGISRGKDQFGGNVGDWNREHVWAKSHGDFGTNPPAGSDAHHIRPADVQVNGIRGNLDFDNGGSPVAGAPGCKVDFNSFEPRDEVKGDVARMIFYMAVRYEGGNGEPDLEVVDAVDNSPDPLHGKRSTLLEWHEFDLPDDFEENRNEVVFGYQENRNPFIDHPEFVDDIWGDPTAVVVTDKPGFRCYPNPVITKVVIDPEQEGTFNYSVKGMDGRQIIQANSISGRTEIDMTAFAPGFYLLIMSDQNQKQIERFKLVKTAR